MPVIEDTHRGRPTLTLKEKEADRFGLTFGVAKARLILANLDAIRDFVAKHPTADRSAA